MGANQPKPSKGPGPKCPTCGVQCASAGALIRHKLIKRH